MKPHFALNFICSPQASSKYLGSVLDFRNRKKRETKNNVLCWKKSNVALSYKKENDQGEDWTHDLEINSLTP